MAAVHMRTVLNMGCSTWLTTELAGQLETVEMQTGNGNWKWKTETVKS